MAATHTPNHHSHYPHFAGAMGFDPDDVIGPGIDHLYVYHIPGTPWRRFEILRIDGTRRDIGYRRCLAVAPNPLREIRRVCRSLIQLQIADFRASRYRPLEGWTCEECQDLVVNSGDVHADHLAPWTFDWLVDDWLCFHALDPGRIEILGSSRYQAHSRFADQRLAEQWTDYHRLHAKLRILCVPCHKRAHRRKA